MEKTASRMISFTNKVMKDDNGELKQGEEYVKLYNKFGFAEIAVILRWKNGLLNGEGDEPAVEFEDTHTEYWKNGRLSCKLVDSKGQRIPAVISNYMDTLEYWEDGKRIFN